MLMKKQIKRFLRMTDERWFSSYFQMLRDLITISKPILRKQSLFGEASLHVNYVVVDNYFAVLCNKYGTDKGSLVQTNVSHPLEKQVHNYADFYDLLFSGLRHQFRNIFECGIGTTSEIIPSSMGKLGRPGASLRVWRDYFPEAEIVGADIDYDCLFQDDRIRTFQVDQTDPISISKMWSLIGKLEFDLIIDDGLHTFESGTTFFTHAIHHLKPGGFYVIEDVYLQDIEKYRSYFSQLDYRFSFVHLTRNSQPLIDNNLVLIRLKD